MLIRFLMSSIFIFSVSGFAMLTNGTKIYRSTRIFRHQTPRMIHKVVLEKLSEENAVTVSNDPWVMTRTHFLDARPSKNNDIFNSKPQNKSQALNIGQENEEPLFKMKQDIQEIFRGTELTDSPLMSGNLARKGLEKLDHIEPDMGPRWRACQLTAMGIYLLQKINNNKFPDDIAVTLYLLQIDKKDQIREKKYMVRALRDLGVYDYIANEQYLNKDMHDETITIGQYNKLLIYLRRKLQKHVLEAIYDSLGKKFEDYAVMENNTEWVPQDREDAYERVINKLHEKKAPILIAVYPGTPGQSEVRTLLGVGWIYLYRYSDPLGGWKLVSAQERTAKGRDSVDDGYFIIHAGLGQYGLNVKNFLKERSIESLTPRMDNINPIELMKHRFKIMNSSLEEFKTEDLHAWPYPEISLFHFSYKLGSIKDMQRKVAQRETSYCRLPSQATQNMPLELSRIDLEAVSSTSLFIEENVPEYLAKDHEKTLRKERVFNKSGTFLYKIKNDYRLILRVVLGHPESSYFVVQKMKHSGGHRTWPQTLWTEFSEIRAQFESFLEMLLVYHNTNLCIITRIVLNRNGLSKEDIENYLEDIKIDPRSSAAPFKKSPFLTMYISDGYSIFRDCDEI